MRARGAIRQEENMNRIVGYRMLALPVGVIVVLAACSGGGSTPTSSPAASPTPSTPSAATATATAPATRVLTPTGVATDATPKPQPTPSVSKTPVASETADAALFKTYFKEISLAKLPGGVKAGPGSCPSPASAYTAKDQICMVFDVRKVPQGVSDGIFDVGGATFVQAKKELSPPVAAVGERIVCQPVTLPVGKYEYKLWVGDALTAVVPFEVKG